MKQLIIILAMGLIIGISFASIDEYYTFNATNGTYTPIVGTNANISSDDVISAAIPIGFTFPYGDYIYNEVKISSNGWIGLGTSQTSSNLTNNLASTTIVPVLAPLWDDCSLAAGICEYLLSGTAPNRIFTIQYTNLKWRYSATTFFNLQARLYENGKIDFVYGSSTGNPNSPSASIGINMLPGGSGWFYSVTPGTPATASTTTENATIATWPGEGTIYEFNPVVAVPNDLAALSITGHTTPTAELSYDYTITVRNRGSNPQTTYQVKLLLGTQEVGSVNGTTIQAGEFLTFTIPWTPSTAGPATLYGKVVLTGDENPTNDQTPPLNITVQPVGVQAVTIGVGDLLARVPMDFFYKNSLFECLFYPDELGFTSGTITSLAFYNNFADSPTNGATKIWLGTTNQADLSAGWIPSTQLTLVFDGNITYPSGENTIIIPLQTPYMHTPGNLVMMVQRPMDTQYYSSSDNFQAQTVGTNRARKVQNDSTVYDPANPPASATVSGQFPKTTIFYSGQAIVNDLGCLSISGNTTPSVGAATPYTVTIKNNGTAVQNDYTVKLMKEGGVLLSSIPGVTINSHQTLDLTINWTPTDTGATYIYGEVELTGDEIATNNQTPHLDVNVYPAGTVAITVGTGNSTGRMPMDFFYKNSLFETIYLSSELNVGGLLTDIQFYNNFVTNLPGMPTNIWVGETTQTDLSAGWIPSTQLTQVFNGNVDYPSGSNDIIIHLTTPYPYGGGNLVVMIERPMDTSWYSSSDVFRTQTGTVSNRTRNAYSDSVDYDPANPPTVTPTAMFPKTTFMFITDGLGAITGTVYGPGNVPLAGATVTVAGTNLSYTTSTDGTFTFPYVAEGEHQVTASKYGYYDVTNTVTVIENQTVTTNFTLTPLPQVTVTGRIVGSDQPTVGLADATINLSGYESYQATTNATGNFTITNVYANHTYNYVAHATGYQDATGQIVVGSTDVNMGDIVVNEMSFPPSNVVATEAIDGTNVTLIWNSPSPTGLTGVEDFELNDGGWVPSSNWSNPLGDWEWTNTYDVANWSPEYTGANIIPPPNCHSGTGMWGTKINTNYTNSGGFNYLTKTFNLSGISEPQLRFWSWENVFGNFDYCQVAVNGTVIWGPSWDYTNTQWQERVVDLSAYAGMSEVEIQFQMYASTVVNYAGWYIDDVYVGPAQSKVTNSPSCIIPSELRGLSEKEAAAYVEKANSPRDRISNHSLSRMETPPSINNDRVMVGYKVWRLLQGQESNEDSWILLTDAVTQDTTFIDTDWATLPDGTYKWAVKSIYSNEVQSEPAFSNTLIKITYIGTIAGVVRNTQNAPISGAIVTCGNVTATTNSVGAYSMIVQAGTHTVAVFASGYLPASQENVIVVDGQTTTVNFVLTASVVIFHDCFESYSNFALSFSPWTLVDVDQSSTYGIQNVSFPNSGSPMAYIIFVPSATTPPVTGANPHSGIKEAASFASINPPNNDWMISPLLHNPIELQFWARSFTDQYGLERFRVGVSTTGTNPTDFTIISGENPVEAPVTWTGYTYPLTDYMDSDIYIGIQCISNNAFMFLVDDVMVRSATPVDDVIIPVLATELQSNYPNPFNPETTIRYSVKETSPVTIEVYNLKGQLIRTLVNEVKTAGNYSVVWNGRDSHNQPVSSGVYFYKMNAGKYSSTKKMIMMK